MTSSDTNKKTEKPLSTSSFEDNRKTDQVDRPLPGKQQTGNAIFMGKVITTYLGKRIHPQKL